MLIYGTHTHVGVDDPAKVLPLINALACYVPHLQALSASSPFWAGEDTGYASNRSMMFQQLPTAGLPYAFTHWHELERYVDDMLAVGVIERFNEIRWDIRPAPHFGTVEIRICDAPPTLPEVLALSALSQCLVEDSVQRLERGESLPSLPRWFVQENKWRACRYGLDAVIIRDSHGEEAPVTESLRALLRRLEPVAAGLGCSEQLALVEDIIVKGASYQRQRTVAGEHGGNLRAVVTALTQELRDTAPS
jgi:carboxylate-amine ligase